MWPKATRTDVPPGDGLALVKVPEGMPDIALHQFGELRKYHGIPEKGSLNDETTRNLIHGYYAAVSLVDAQIGKLLQALEENDLMDNTIIVLWGDHGWKLGHQGATFHHGSERSKRSKIKLDR